MTHTRTRGYSPKNASEIRSFEVETYVRNVGRRRSWRRNVIRYFLVLFRLQSNLCNYNPYRVCRTSCDNAWIRHENAWKTRPQWGLLNASYVREITFTKFGIVRRACAMTDDDESLLRRRCRFGLEWKKKGLNRLRGFGRKPLHNNGSSVTNV